MPGGFGQGILSFSSTEELESSNLVFGEAGLEDFSVLLREGRKSASG